MPTPTLEFPKVTGKSILELPVSDELFGREVLVTITDGTQVSIAVGIVQTVKVRYSKDGSPDLLTFLR